MQDLIEALRHDANAFGPTLAATAQQRGLAVTDKTGKVTPIPITATPVILDEAEIRRRADLSSKLSSAVFKLAKSVLSGSARDLIAGALSPLERKMAERTSARIERLATTRVDYFVSGPKAMALELNATIPAMQGYSDIAAHTFIEVVGRHWGMNDAAIAKLQARNGSNALALYRALLDGYAQERSGAAPKRMAVLCRRNDSQITELRYLVDRFNSWGTETELVHPDELSGEHEVQARGKTFDFIYRHLFVRRLEEIEAPYVAELLASVPSEKVVILNPPASQVEVKATFALLSQATTEPDLARAAGITEAELEAARSCIPWTRPFRRAATVDPDGKKVPDLVERVAAEPRRFVLKRSWDYGGKAVFVGTSVGEPGFEERVKAAYGSALSWPELCARAAEDRVGGGLVVQELVSTQPESHLLCEGKSVREASVYVDFSAYGSVGLERTPAWGGVCRGSVSRIVNILGGGGVLPLLTSEVASTLLTARRAYR